MKSLNEYKPFGLQVLFHNSKAKFKAFIGGFGSGKTTAGVIEALDYSLSVPSSRGLIARKTYSSLIKTTLQSLWEWLPYDFVKSYNKHDHLIVLDGGKGLSQIFLSDLEHPDKIKSLDLDYFYVDEASEIKEEVFLMLIGRLKRTTAFARGWITSNPVSKDHWIYHYFVELEDKDFEVFYGGRTEDNPYVSKDYLESLRKRDYEWQRVYVDGQWIEKGSTISVFNVDENILGRYEPIDGLPILRGWDFGFRMPVVVFAQLRNGVFYILGAVWREKILLPDFIKLVKYHYQGFKFEDFCDIAGKQRTGLSYDNSITLLHKEGIFPKCKQVPIESSLDQIRQLLSEDKLKIDFRAKIVYEALKEAVYNEDGQLEKDLYYEHFLDALRYIISNKLFHSKQINVVRNTKNTDLFSPQIIVRFKGGNRRLREIPKLSLRNL